MYIVLPLILLVVVLLVALLLGVGPILTGFAAKEMCSGIFLGGREPAHIQGLDLGGFPLKLAKVEVNRSEKSVTATLWGMFRQTAVFREGLGATLGLAPGPGIQIAPPADTDPETLPWPQGELLPDQLPSGIDQDQLSQSLQWALSNPQPSKPHHTLACVVLYKDQLVAEQYAEGLDSTHRLAGWSMAKSITNALTGILVGQGKLSLEDRTGLWPEGDPRAAITLNDLLQMNSGLRWQEEYKRVSDVVNMLYKSPSAAGYALKRPLASPPGTVWNYASGSSNLISKMIRDQFPDADSYYDFPYQALFHRIGMYSARLEVDAEGMFVGSSYCFATPRDWARFGLLYMHDGCWGEQRILPEGWVEYTRTPAPNTPLHEYGAHFKLNAGASGNPRLRDLPDAPTDTYYAEGYNGQVLFIIPSRDLVVVRLGVSKKGHFDNNLFLKKLLQAFPG